MFNDTHTYYCELIGSKLWLLIIVIYMILVIEVEV